MSFSQFVSLIGSGAKKDFYWVNLTGHADGLVGTMAGGLADGQAGATAWIPADPSYTYTLHFDNLGNIVGSRRNTSSAGANVYSMASFDEANARMVVSGQVSPSNYETGICAMPIDGSTTNFSDSIGSSGLNYLPYSNHVDASGNIYTFGSRDPDPSYPRLRFDYWNDSGTYQGGYRGSSSFSSRCLNGTTDSSGNLYTVSYVNDTYLGNVRNAIEVMKFNSSFAVQWGVRLIDNSNLSMPDSQDGSISVTSSGSIVNATVKLGPTGPNSSLYNRTYTTRLDGSTGAYVSSYLTSLATSATYTPMAYNDTGDGWVYTVQNGTSNASVNIFSSSLSGQGRYTIAWTGAASSGNYIVGVRGAPNNAIYITGVVKGLPSTATADWKMFTIKLPKDGSLTGTFTVGSEEVTIGFASASRTTSQLHDTTDTATWSASNSTDLGSWGFGIYSTANYTESVVEIP